MPTRMTANARNQGLRLAFGVALALTCWTAPGAAQQRLPWEPPAASPTYPQAQGPGYDNQAGPYDAEPYRPPAADNRYGDVYNPPPQSGPLIRQPLRQPRYDGQREYGAYAKPYDRNYPDGRSPNYGAAPPPYSGPPPRDYQAPGYYEPGNANRDRIYDDPGYEAQKPGGSYSINEITNAGHAFFGSISKGLASVIEYAFQKTGRPNGYILGEGAGGAFIAGLRYGEGTLYTKSAGTHPIYWQGPSIGYDAGAEGSKTMVLVYNMQDPSELYKRYGGIDSSAYLVGGVGITFLKNKHVILAPIRAGIGLRLGANIGYLKYTRRPTWNPF